MVETKQQETRAQQIELAFQPPSGKMPGKASQVLSSVSWKQYLQSTDIVMIKKPVL